MINDKQLADFFAARLNELEASMVRARTHFMRFSTGPGDWTRLICEPHVGPFRTQAELADMTTALYIGQDSDPERVMRSITADRALLKSFLGAYTTCEPRRVR